MKNCTNILLILSKKKNKNSDHCWNNPINFSQRQNSVNVRDNVESVVKHVFEDQGNFSYLIFYFYSKDKQI